jgi:excisionase family DNA binding protein
MTDAEPALTITLSDGAIARLASRLADSPDFLDALADRVAERLGLATGPESRYLTIPEAAEYLRCKRQRVYDLLSARTLSRYKDGSRTLLSRAEVEEYVEQSVVPRREPLSERKL